MNRFFLTTVISFLLMVVNSSAQTERFVVKNEDGYSSDWIVFFENGRFELVHDEECYAYVDGAGVYRTGNDFIYLDFFKLPHSKQEVTENINLDYTVNDVSVQVFSMKDSSVVTSATVFARGVSRQVFDFNEKVDSNGMISFSFPKRKCIRYMRVFADNYIDCEIEFEEKYNTGYSIKIYLSEDPLMFREYIGETYKSEKLTKKGRNELIYNGKTYKKTE